jgi:hypothetical protein
VQRIREISRRNCRDEFESRFRPTSWRQISERIYYRLASMGWLNMRQIAARPTRNLAEAALARYAARRQHPALNRDRFSRRRNKK